MKLSTYLGGLIRAEIKDGNLEIVREEMMVGPVATIVLDRAAFDKLLQFVARHETSLSTWLDTNKESISVQIQKQTELDSDRPC